MEKAVPGETRVDVEVLVFRASERLFAVPAGVVVEVLRAATLAPLADAHPAVEGILNLRGNLVPVISIPALLQPVAPAMQHSDHLIVVRVDEATLALRVERAIDLVALPSDEPAPPSAPSPADATPADADSAEAGSSEGWIERVAQTPHGIVHLIELHRLLPGAALSRLLQRLSPATDLPEAMP